METDAKATRRPLRPERRSFACLGAQVEVIDAEGVLRRPSDASVLRVDRLPESLRGLTMTVTVDGADVVFGAKATVDRLGPSARQNPLNSPRARAAAAFGIVLQATKSPALAAAAGAYAGQAVQDRAAQAAAPSPTPEADVPDTLFIELHGHAWVVTVERSLAGAEYALWSRLQPGGVFKKELPRLLEETPAVVVVLTTTATGSTSPSPGKAGSTGTLRFPDPTRPRAATSSTRSSPG